MSPFKSFALVERFIRNLRGGSQPILVEASDGLLYVVKFPNNLQGPNLLFNEAMGTELYRAFKLPVPDWAPLTLTDSFIDQNPGCWIQTQEGPLRPASGLCLGSRFLGGAGVRLLEILPRSSFSRVRNLRDFWLAWLVDICAGHADNRQAIFKEEDNGQLTAFFVDHGHMFGGPKGELQAHFLASRYLDSRIFLPPSPDSILELSCMELQRVVGSLRAESLWQKIKGLPDEWASFQALGEFVKCIDRLTRPHLLRCVHEMIVDSIRQTSAYDGGDFQYERKQPASVLCPGIQPRTLVPDFVA